MMREANARIWKQSPCRQDPAPPTKSLVNFPQSNAGGGRQAWQAWQGGQDRQDRTDRSQEQGARRFRVGRRIDVGIDVGTRGIGRDLGFCSARRSNPSNPSDPSDSSRAARTVADPPDWNSGSWVMHAPLDD